MKIKMAAIDLDGTLLHDDMSLSDFSKDIIRKAEHRGIHIVLATGRMFDAARPKAEELGLSDTESRLWHTWEMHFTIRRKSRRG